MWQKCCDYKCACLVSQCFSKLVGQRENAIRCERRDCAWRTGQLAAVQRGTQTVRVKSLLGTTAVCPSVSCVNRSAQHRYF